MPDDIIEPPLEEAAAAALREARNLARAFRSHMPEGEKCLINEVLAKAGPFIRTLTSNPEIEARDAYMLSVLVQMLFRLGELRDEVREMRGGGKRAGFGCNVVRSPSSKRGAVRLPQSAAMFALADSLT